MRFLLQEILHFLLLTLLYFNSALSYVYKCVTCSESNPKLNDMDCVEPSVAICEQGKNLVCFTQITISKNGKESEKISKIA